MPFARLFTFLLLSSVLFLPSGWADQVFLHNGDRISGTVIDRVEKSFVEIQSIVLGTIKLDRTHIKEILTDAEIRKQLEAEMSAEEKETWAGKLEAGFDRQRGNTNETELYGEGSLTGDWERHQVQFKVRSFYSSENRKMNEQKHYGKARYDLKFGENKRWFNFYQLEGDRDRFANIQYRLVSAAGLGNHLIKKDNFKLMAEIGMGHTHTSFIDNTRTTNEMTVTPHAYAEWIIFGKTKLWEDITVYPSLTENGEFRLRSETGIDNPITDSVSLVFKLIDEYNSNPGDAKKNDLRILSSLAYKF